VAPLRSYFDGKTRNIVALIENLGARFWLNLVVDMETERGCNAEGEVSGQSPWIALDETTPLIRQAPFLPDQSDYPSMMAGVHVGVNGLIPDHVMHGEVAIPPSPTLENDLALIGRVVQDISRNGDFVFGLAICQSTVRMKWPKIVLASLLIPLRVAMFRGSVL
jgi:hypothetical protein